MKIKLLNKVRGMVAAMLAIAMMLGIVAAMPGAAHAASANALADLINNFDPGPGSSGKLTASVASSVFVNVSGKVTGAKNKLTLNINLTVGVKWMADYSGSVESTMIELTGAGVFGVYSGGVIKNSTGRAISSTGANASISVSGGTVSVTGGSNAIRADGANSTVSISSGTVTSSGGGITISAGQDSSSSVTVNVSGGTVSNTGDSNAIGTAGNGSSVNISGGTVHVTHNNVVIFASNGARVNISGGRVSGTEKVRVVYAQANAAIKISGGLVFGLSNSISGSVDSVVVATSSAPVPVISNPAVVVAWDKPSSGTPTYTVDTTTNLAVNSGATVKWAKNGSESGIRYSNGSNNGFYAVSGVTVKEAATSPAPGGTSPSNPTPSNPGSTNPDDNQPVPYDDDDDAANDGEDEDGAAVSDGIKEENEDEEKDEFNWWWIVAIALGVVVIGGGIAFFMMMSKKNKQLAKKEHTETSDKKHAGEAEGGAENDGKDAK